MANEKEGVKTIQRRKSSSEPMETRYAIGRANIKRGYKLRIKKPCFVECTKYGFVYDNRTIKKEWLI